MLGNYPKKFDISKCLNQDRTFPANFPDKVTPGLESTKQQMMKQINPRSIIRNKEKELEEKISKRPMISTAAHTFRAA